MAIVYLAVDLRHHRPVALKVLRPELGAAVGADRFLREIELTAQLQHPHILPLFDSGEADGLLYYVMPYVAGETLRSRLAREGGLPLEDAVRIAREIADALAYAHALGVVHRDVKPENVLLSGGHALVADFGVATAVQAAAGARLTETGLAVGTPAYMSPEQAAGERQLDGRSDVYALGCVLYEMLAGEPPFTGPTAQAIVARRLAEPAPSVRRLRPAVPPLVDAAIRRALERHPADRFATAGQFRDALAGTPPPPAGERRSRLRRVAPALLVAVLTAGTGLLLRHNFMAPTEVPDAGPPDPPAPSTDAPPSRVAVLPFRDLGGDAADRYFAEGMTEEVTSTLARLSGLAVIDRSSAARFAGADVGEAGRALGVSSVLEGAVRRSGDQVRISVRLIDASTREQVWAQDYDRRFRDVLAIQSDVAQQVARALRVRLAPAERSRIARPPTANPEAYDLYLRGLFHFSEADRPRHDSAIALLARATVLDPDFALARAQLARAYVVRLFSHDPDRRWEERAFVEIAKALATDSTLAEAYVARGELTWTKANGFRAEDAIRDYHRALRHRPNLREAHDALGRIYLHVGLFDEAEAEFRRALELDPSDRFALTRLGALPFFRGRYDSAVAALGELGLDWLGEYALALRAVGRREEALAVLDSALERGVGAHDLDPVLAARAVLYADLGRGAEARADIRRAVRHGRELSHFHHGAYYIGVASALLGDRREALAWLGVAAREGLPCFPCLANDPDLAPLREDPEFQALLASVRARYERFRTLRREAASAR